ncbi:hypothetical protein [Kineosporia sp. NBRC 101731]|uniref:hypothetical protein n=1 Tax=Kineosporia sp. NBRC 101731 TaxID=3032199 RepID=UPI0025560663|nr:hypothetical protein [Kineosporia sp. NBRC 101731]
MTSFQAAAPGPHPLHWLLAAAIIAGLLSLLVMFVAVVSSILNSGLSLGMKVLWVLFVVWMPVLAWLAWYFIGRPETRRHSLDPA